MRPDLMELLCCPVCHGDLALTVTQRTGEEIVDGNLACAQCKIDFPIEDGIPNLLPPEDRDP
ncbi:MAG: methytransferase partner Trm112 [Thermoplasmata archaeon]|nr:methytransferase partner Trm112 [Thermoplasmata archaeon]